MSKRQRIQVEQQENKHWDSNNCHTNLKTIDKKDLIVKHKGVGGPPDFCSVFANGSLPAMHSDEGILYFEAKVVNFDKHVIVGFGTKEMLLEGKFVGELANTVGYKNDGNFYVNGNCWINRNAKFSSLNVIGCGVKVANRQIIFTIEGIPLETAHMFISSSVAINSLIPCLSLHDPGDIIEANFGPVFKFDPANFKVEQVVPFTQQMQNEQNCWDDNCRHDEIELYENFGALCLTDDDACVVFAIYSIASTAIFNNNIFYFEIKITNFEKHISFGFAVKENTGDRNEKLDKNVGTFLYENTGDFWINGIFKKNEVVTANFRIGDVVGCGVNLSNRQIFFTKNQNKNKTVFCISSALSIQHLYPCVSLQRKDDEIRANFGPNFKFNLANLT